MQISDKTERCRRRQTKTAQNKQGGRTGLIDRSREVPLNGYERCCLRASRRHRLYIGRTDRPYQPRSIGTTESSIAVSVPFRH